MTSLSSDAGTVTSKRTEWLPSGLRHGIVDIIRKYHCTPGNCLSRNTRHGTIKDTERNFDIPPNKLKCLNYSSMMLLLLLLTLSIPRVYRTIKTLVL